jgi:cytidylate kinase
MDNQETFAVCLGRELGSGGHAIAKHIADQLHLKFYDKELIYIAASKSGYSKELFEKSDEEKSTIHTFFTNFIPFLGSTDFYGNQVDEESLFSILSQTIRELAEQDNCLFVGRCAEYILRHKPLMTSIFISADMQDRVDRLMDSHHISAEHAKHFIINNDKHRASFHDFYSENQWGMASTYELCVNSSKLGLEDTELFITDYIRKRFSL